jgi:CRP/FNR family transcriptional regulator
MAWKPTTLAAKDARVERRPKSDVSFPAFAPIVSNAFEELKNIPDPTSIATGTMLIEQDTPADYVVLLRHGLVKLLYATPEGRETTLGLRTSGWYAGAASVLMNTPSVYSVVSVTPCTVSRIPAAEFSAALMQNARMMRHFLQTICNELISQSAAQAQVMSGSAEQRLTHFMRERTAAHERLKTLDALPHLKQMELAQLLAITPEHLSRLLHKSATSENTLTSVGALPAVKIPATRA